MSDKLGFEELRSKYKVSSTYLEAANLNDSFVVIFNSLGRYLYHKHKQVVFRLFCNCLLIKKSRCILKFNLLLQDILSKAFAANDIELLEAFSKTAHDVDRKAVLDQAFRDKLLELLTEENDVLENYVCFCIESCRRQLVTPTMPVVLLGDIFDALTLNKCEKMFTYVENGVNIWKEELFFGACKNNLLRMCNDLLRRLSRSQNTVFCGRILLFLAKFFPFSERSGLNIVSEFNLENITEFGADTSSTLKDSLDEEMVVEKDNSKLVIDYNLYCKFWSLQEHFRNPNTCYNRLQWKTFVSVSLIVSLTLSVTSNDTQ